MFHFPIYWHLKREPEGQPPSGRLSLLPFFGEAKKGSGCRATPGRSPRSGYRITNPGAPSPQPSPASGRGSTPKESAPDGEQGYQLIQIRRQPPLDIFLVHTPPLCHIGHLIVTDLPNPKVLRVRMRKIKPVTDAPGNIANDSVTVMPISSHCKTLNTSALDRMFRTSRIPGAGRMPR